MAIQFSCPSCGKTLSVPDNAGGRQARCPNCSTVIRVPDQTPPADDPGEYQLSPPESGPPSQPASSPQTPSFGPPEQTGTSFPDVSAPQKPNPYSDNPYASPTMGYDEKRTITTGKSAIQPTIIDLGNVFSDAWNLYTNNIGSVLLCVLPVLFYNSLGGYVLQIATALVAQSEEAGIAFFWIGYVVMLVLGTFLGIGQTIVLLDVARGRPTSPDRFFSAGRYLLWIILGNIAFVIMVYLGLIFLIVPGIILALMFGQYYFLMIDQEMSFGDAFTASKEITGGNKLTLFGVVILAGLMAAGSCLVFCVPALFFIPYANMIYVVAYLKMAGQPIGLKQAVPHQDWSHLPSG